MSTVQLCNDFGLKLFAKLATNPEECLCNLRNQTFSPHSLMGCYSLISHLLDPPHWNEMLYMLNTQDLTRLVDTFPLPEEALRYKCFFSHPPGSSIPVPSERFLQRLNPHGNLYLQSDKVNWLHNCRVHLFHSHRQTSGELQQHGTTQSV